MPGEAETLVKYDKSLPYIEGREPHQEPVSYLVKDGENSYKVVEGRRQSNMLLVNKLRDEVGKWRNSDYSGVTDTTRELLNFWFDQDHLINGNSFNYWFCQREAIETLIYLFEVNKYSDLKDVILTYAHNFKKDLFTNAVEIVEDLEGKRKVIRYFPELEQEGEQDLPEEGLLRYAFKMATGSGKTYAMALIIIWSYFNRIREDEEIARRYADNFLILAPNIIVYERLAKDFSSKKIFHELPLIPKPWKALENLKVTLREDGSPLNPSGNLIVNNIQRLFESREDKWTPDTVVDAMLGRNPQKNLTKTPVTQLGKLKELENLIVINDEAHHVHEEELQWHKTLMSLHNSLPSGLNLWLDFSATPKTQTGTYYPWIIVDYPLAQAVEDRIVKAPLIVHRIDKRDPENINRDNVVQKYGDWITAALERWKEHHQAYLRVGKKPVLFIMAEKNEYADRITDAIRKRKNTLNLSKPEEEVLVIHTDNTGEVRKSELEELRKYVREIDLPENKVKVIVSVMMLREGWDVQNVTIILGLRPFTAKAEILPEQAVGRGLRIMGGVNPGVQTLEVMGTNAFENFVKGLEKEGVGINVTREPPPLSIMIEPERSRLKYDIEIPTTDFRYTRNYVKLETVNALEIPSLYKSDKLEEDRKILLMMNFPITETEIHQVEISIDGLASGRELASYITNEVMKRARLTCNFSKLYPIIEKYLLKTCFEIEIKDIEDFRLRKNIADITIQDAVIDHLADRFGRETAEIKEVVVSTGSMKLSKIETFPWKRKHLRLDKTVFNFVAVYNNFEVSFARFLDRCPDITKFSAVADKFKLDYLSSKGSIKFYWPDFIAVQRVKNKDTFWFIETKGREYQDTDRKDETIMKWCRDVSIQKRTDWRYVKVSQTKFESLRYKVNTFLQFIKLLES